MIVKVALFAILTYDLYIIVNLKHQSYLSSLVWQFRGAASLLSISSRRPYGKLRPSDDWSTTRPWCAGFTHSGFVLNRINFHLSEQQQRKFKHSICQFSWQFHLYKKWALSKMSHCNLTYSLKVKIAIGLLITKATICNELLCVEK